MYANMSTIRSTIQSQSSYVAILSVLFTTVVWWFTVIAENIFHELRLVSRVGINAGQVSGNMREICFNRASSVRWDKHALLDVSI